nr:MAG TPA: hypothetical protein [Bacteriophage sp.]
MLQNMHFCCNSQLGANRLYFKMYYNIYYNNPLPYHPSGL